MMDWQYLNDELDRWQQADLNLDVWLRDDDAIEPTVQLEHLLGLCRAFQVPVLLAIIPGLAHESLASLLAGEVLVRPCQHGWRHVNHAPESEKSAEFGDHRPLEVMLADLWAGRKRFAALFPGQANTLFVPPWNRLMPDLATCLPEIGFEAVSAFRPMKQPGIGGLRVINPDVDIINWKAARTLRPVADIENEIVTHLNASRTGGQGTARLGLLLHHLVQDAGAWALLDSLLTVLARHSHVRFANPVNS